MFELISAVVRYFAGGIKERRRIDYRFRPPCVKRMWHRSYCKRFFGATSYRVASVVIEYYKRILIILVSIRTEYDILIFPLIILFT